MSKQLYKLEIEIDLDELVKQEYVLTQIADDVHEVMDYYSKDQRIIVESLVDFIGAVKHQIIKAKK